MRIEGKDGRKKVLPLSSLTLFTTDTQQQRAASAVKGLETRVSQEKRKELWSLIWRTDVETRTSLAVI